MPATYTTTPGGRRLECERRVDRWACRRPATQAVADYRWHHGQRAVSGWEVICNVHASADRRRVYGTREPVPVDDAIIADYDARMAAAEADVAARQAVSRQRAQDMDRRAKQRALEDHYTEWTSTLALREDRWFEIVNGEAAGRWQVTVLLHPAEHSADGSSDTIHVMLAAEPGEPATVVVRAPSPLTLCPSAMRELVGALDLVGRWAAALNSSQREEDVEW